MIMCVQGGQLCWVLLCPRAAWITKIFWNLRNPRTRFCGRFVGRRPAPGSSALHHSARSLPRSRRSFRCPGLYHNHGPTEWHGFDRNAARRPPRLENTVTKYGMQNFVPHSSIISDGDEDPANGNEFGSSAETSPPPIHILSFVFPLFAKVLIRLRCTHQGQSQWPTNIIPARGHYFQ